MKDFTTEETRQILSLHYLPGLRLAYELIGTKIAELESVLVSKPRKEKPVSRRKPVQEVEAQLEAAEEALANRRSRKVYSPAKKRALVKAAAKEGSVAVHRRTGVAISALSRWKKEEANAA